MQQNRICEVCGFVAGNDHGLTIHRKKTHDLYELTCRHCGVGLTVANWLPYVKRATTRICATCWRKRDKIYQHRRNGSDKARLRSRNHAQRVKLKVFSHYSPSLLCQCNLENCWHDNQTCSVSDIRALSIDHIDGGGKMQRRTLKLQGYGSSFYRWLVTHAFPEGYQVLCMNCNWIKADLRGERLRRPNPLVTGIDTIGRSSN
jgi:hypothetical protein